MGPAFPLIYAAKQATIVPTYLPLPPWFAANSPTNILSKSLLFAVHRAHAKNDQLRSRSDIVFHQRRILAASR
jgi:hypothetical protein